MAPAPLKHLLQDHGLADHPLFAQAKVRGIKALAGHAESTDVTNDVNGGPPESALPRRRAKRRSGILSAPRVRLKVIALEGEFAMTEGHAQELKTQALALQVGKRLRVMLSDNNAGIDDVLLGGVIDRKFDAYRLDRPVDFLRLERLHAANGNDYGQVRFRAQDHGGLGRAGPPPDDRHRQDHQGLLAGRGRRQNSRATATKWSAIPAIPTR